MSDVPRPVRQQARRSTGPDAGSPGGFQYLADVPALSALSEAEEAALARVAFRRTVPPRCIVLLEGQRTDLLAVLIRGRAESVWIDEDGTKTLLLCHRPGDLVGGVPGADDGLLPATLLTVDESAFVFIPRGELAAVVRRGNGALALGMLAQVGSQQRRLERRIRYLTRRSGLLKIAGYLRELASQFGVPGEDGAIVLRETVAQQTIADACGLSRETVCRLLPGLAEVGIVPTPAQGWLIGASHTRG